MIRISVSYYEIRRDTLEYKTNVMRILDKNKVSYLAHAYDAKETINGMEVAKALNQNPNQVFKTLLTVSKSKNYYVFVIPVNKELDLKKCAIAVGEKAIEMVALKDLLPITGYVHGGCSPIGMRKLFTTVFDSSSQDYDTIIFSGGKIGYQVQLNLADLIKIIAYTIQPLTK
jgi:Cys-tRNA(Pro)/Cys-tRNA(Cys) deacylase